MILPKFRKLDRQVRQRLNLQPVGRALPYEPFPLPSLRTYGLLVQDDQYLALQLHITVFGK